MDSLWGIDNPTDRRKKTKSAIQHVTGVWHLLLLIFGSATIGVFASRYARNHVHFAGAEDLAAFAGMSIPMLLFWIWMRHRSERYMEAMLKGEGRCAKCGYLLKASQSVVCPECGNPANQGSK